MLCRKAKDRYFEDQCLELEMLDKTHSQKLYDKVKELQPRKHRVMQQMKDKKTFCCCQKMKLWKDGRNMWKNCMRIIGQTKTWEIQQIKSI